MTDYSNPLIDPFNENVQDFEPQTPPLDEIIRLAVLDGAMKLRVSMPAQIVKINGNQSVDVQPLLQARYANSATPYTLPVIQHVPVQMPMGADYSIKLPIAVGDTGNLLFCDRSLDVWLASQGGIVNPNDSRQHDISDAVFYPGLVPFALQTQDSTTDMVLTNGAAKIRLQKAGTFAIENQNQELLNLLDQLLDTLINKTFTLTMLGAEPFIESTQSLLSDIRTKLDTLKGSG